MRSLSNSTQIPLAFSALRHERERGRERERGGRERERGDVYRNMGLTEISVKSILEIGANEKGKRWLFLFPKDLINT